MTPAREEGRVTTEAVAAPSPVIGSVSSPRLDTAEDSAALIRRQVAAFQMAVFLDDVVAAILPARQRLAVEDVYAGVEMCRACQEYPAAYAGRCFSCQASRRLPA